MRYICYYRERNGFECMHETKTPQAMGSHTTSQHGFKLRQLMDNLTVKKVPNK